MKRFSYIVMLFLVTFLMTGCVKFDATMDINRDKSMNLSVIYGIDVSNNSEGSYQNVFSDSDREMIKSFGFNIDEYKEEGIRGVRLTKKISNIDDISSENVAQYELSSLLANEEKNKYLFKVKRGLFRDVYTTNFTLYNASTTSEVVQPDGSVQNIEEGSIFDEKEGDTLSNRMKLFFRLHLPTSAIESNATSVENHHKTLIWKLDPKVQGDIQFTFAMYHKGTIVLVSMILLLIISIILFLIWKNRKKGKKQEQEKEKNEQNVNPTIEEPLYQKPVIVTDTSTQNTVSLQEENPTNSTNI